MPHTLNEIIPILQIAIGPVILISGVGMLLLVMTGRFGRMIDRARVLAKELDTAPPAEAANIRAQIAILFRRARWMRAGLALASLSMLLAAALVILLFTTELFDKQWVQLIILFFVGALFCLIGAVLSFLYDVHLSLVALKLELGDAFQPRP
ncbi:MAG: DUF2721 domain-containing protein [Verrucomicrobia bacterium]|nr:DUF2721 domain-containing protein [Verrucomicrobiota bacterium]NBU09615.1 DUF2721 domain-containing protein [Pseudomonadota bacterium]NDA67510.1 DUF2721 domain-containing protein [Verrucomicrobiota bacterium]NDB77131.1 DUF2721 domain-containing protein [Verrucomicrobiota bacterium]NDD39330.1 DUF2721 domain-containing protein [Verrucomicrobiota bacterium]